MVSSSKGKHDFKDAIKELKNSPTFALTLCAKELAHSNFWAWLINVEDQITGMHPFVDVFIDKFNSSNCNFIKVEREKGNRDLTIYYSCNDNAAVDDNGYSYNIDAYCVVVENKLKSVPTIEQLRGYEEKLVDDEKEAVKHNKKKRSRVHWDCIRFTRGLLTGIEKDAVDLTGENWDFVSYTEIAKRIQDINNKVNISKHDKSIITEYCKDIDNIAFVLNETLKDKNGLYVWDPNPELEQQEIRLGDIYLKILASRFSNYIQNRINNNPLLKTDKMGLPIAESSYNHKHPTITVVYKLIDGKNEKGRIGVQIEANEFRIYGGPSHDDVNDLWYHHAENLGWFEKYNHKMIREKQSGMQKKYCSYNAKGKYCHYYQHWDLSNKETGLISDGGISFDVLYDEIEKELLFAQQLINQDFVTF